MIKPIQVLASLTGQRVCKYPLLIRELRKNVGDDNGQDARELDEAAEAVCSLS